MSTMQKIIQRDQDGINKDLLSRCYRESNLDVIPGVFSRNKWLPTFLSRFTHIDTFYNAYAYRVQGWLKPSTEDSISTPELTILGFDPEYGLFVSVVVERLEM